MAENELRQAGIDPQELQNITPESEQNIIGRLIVHYGLDYLLGDRANGLFRGAGNGGSHLIKGTSSYGHPKTSNV